tara:strand:- start:271 stop:438 length:168 start_codon:yes stop_codon:yes gene_type:complete
MGRVNKQILDYIADQEKKAKQMSYVKDLKKEVEINGTGTHKYRIKYGPNKGTVVK